MSIVIPALINNQVQRRRADQQQQQLDAKVAGQNEINELENTEAEASAAAETRRQAVLRRRGRRSTILTRNSGLGGSTVPLGGSA